MEKTWQQKATLTLITILLIGSLLAYTSTNIQAFSDEILQMGAVGEDVIELQTRLKEIGYYHGEINGVFDWATYFALIDFQTEYRLPFNGLVGPPTKDQLVKITTYNEEIKTTPEKGAYQNVPSGYSENDVELMARTVHAEARGEPYIGQVAVAAVILNRVNSPTFPNSISGVIYEPLAFTAVADGQINLPADEASKRAVMDAMNGLDPSGDAVYYFNPDIATSDWIFGRPQIKRIGKHIFCK
jgi:N-acetylmuramoyl-L-alanine amidase